MMKMLKPRDHRRRRVIRLRLGSMLMVAALVVAIGWMLIPFVRWLTRPPMYHADTSVVEKVIQEFALMKEQQQGTASSSSYKPAETEQYFHDHLDSTLAYDTKLQPARGCDVWKNASVAGTQINDQLRALRTALKRYWKDVRKFSYLKQYGAKDIRRHLLSNNGTGAVVGAEKESICRRLQVDGGASSYFSPSSLSHVSSSGYVEPLVTPMRDADFCFSGNDLFWLRQGGINSIEYLVHDFTHMCQQLKPTSKIVMLDIGASPKYANWDSPWFEIIRLYQRFGFAFDHIYAYEITPFSAQDVYSTLVPQEFHTAYHWINAGISTEPGHPLNPWTMLESGDFTDDDLIIVKLDIDTPSVEIPLTYQLLQSLKLTGLVDHFYFEHHVQMEEMRRHWSRAWSGTIADSFRLFHALRLKGVAAHFWV